MIYDTFIFFDIECANCYGGEGKMCSFGYVVVDCDFGIIETDDIVMNPEAKFDWYLFSKKNRCPLAYPKNFFYAKPNFTKHYDKIKSLLTQEKRAVIGFASANDVGFIVTACERYNLPLINFSAYDCAPILKNDKAMQKRLEAWAEFYHIDTNDLQAHKSQDDAMINALVMKAFCTEHKMSLFDVVKANRGVATSSSDAQKTLEARRQKKAQEKAQKKEQYSEYT